MKWTADFETTTDPNDCRVWAYGVCKINEPEYFEYGNNIKDFLIFLRHHSRDDFYFHNLKFDGDFIIHYLLTHGWKHQKDRKLLDGGQFYTLISDKGMFYMMEICFERNGNRKESVKIYDSLKIIPLSVDKVAKAFGLPINKLKIDYHKFREEGYMLDSEEIAYLNHDVKIMAMALNQVFRRGSHKNDSGVKCTS